MPSLPSYCQNCDYAFQDNSIYVENSTNITVEGCTTQCPKCGGVAKMMEGTFDAVGDRLHMKSGVPPITRRMLEQFDLLTRHAQRSGMGLPVYFIETQKIHHKLGQVVLALAKKHIKTTVVLAAVVTAIQACGWDGNKLLDQTGVAGLIKHNVEKLYDADNGSDNNLQDLDKDVPGSESNSTENSASDERVEDTIRI